MTYSYFLTSLLFAMTVAYSACSFEQSSEQQSWSIDSRSSGGFAGGGNGNVTIDSDGHISYQKPGPPTNQPAPCTGTLSKKQLSPLAAVVSTVNPKDWKIGEPNVAASDAFVYSLQLRRGKESYDVTWADNTAGQLPDDLKKLTDVVNTLKEAQAKKCAQH